MSRFHRLLAVALPLLAACAESPTDALSPGLAAIAVRAVAPPALSQFGSNLAVEQVRVRVYRVVNDIPEDVVNRVVPWNPNNASINLSVNVVTQASSEQLFVDLSYETATGQVLFVAGQVVTVQAGQAVSPPPLQPFYTGPGNNVASIAITPATPTVAAGDTLTFGVTALDSSQAPVAGVYVSWSASGGTISALGRLRAPSGAGSVQVVARTPNGTADTTTVTVIPANAAVVSGRVVDASSGLGLAGAQVIVLDAQGTAVDTLTTASDGSYTSGPLAPGSYTIAVGLQGYVATDLFNASLGSGGATTVATIPLVPAGQGGAATLGGTVRDASTNGGIQGATVELRAGVNAAGGSVVATTTSDTLGVYFFPSVPVGTYTVTASATGFTTGSRTAVSFGFTQPLTDDVILSATGGGVARIVLTWGATPQDLDAHLTGPDTAGTRFHVYYSSQGISDAPPYASLDVDDTDGNGPETITIWQQATGVYRFSVHDYDNAGANPSTALAGSGARVELYIGGTLVQTFFVPNQAGTLWTVFELNGTRVTPINAMSYESNSDAVTLRRPGATTDARTIGHDRRPKP